MIKSEQWEVQVFEVSQVRALLLMTLEISLKTLVIFLVLVEEEKVKHTKLISLFHLLKLPLVLK